MPTETFRRAIAGNAEQSDFPGEEMDSGAVVLSRIVALLAERKRLVVAATLAGGLLAAGVAFLLPNMYTAKAMIVSPQKDQSAVSMLLGQLGPIAAAAGADLGLKNPAELYVGILASRTIADAVIKQHGLKAEYRTDTDVETREELDKRAHFSTGRDSLIRIEVEDHDPNRAASMANTYVAQLTEQNRRLAISEASQRRRFLEHRLQEAKTQLASAEEAMKNTQQNSGLIEVSGQTHVAIASSAQMRAQITAGEVALARLKTGATSENPLVRETETELAALRAQLKNLQSAGDGPLVGASSIPKAGLDYIRRLRDLKYYEFLFELLAKQYEAARLDESKAGPTIQVVDYAVPPDKKSGPHRLLITILGCFGGAGAAIAYAYFQASRSAIVRQA